MATYAIGIAPLQDDLLSITSSIKHVALGDGLTLAEK